MSFCCHWQLLSVLPALTPGLNEVAEDMVGVAAVSMAAPAVGVSMAAPAVGVSMAASVVVGFAVVTAEVVFEADMVAGVMGTVTATGVVGGMGLASG
jgi:hypothetical protein